jgi:hypothetical protein
MHEIERDNALAASSAIGSKGEFDFALRRSTISREKAGPLLVQNRKVNTLSSSEFATLTSMEQGSERTSTRFEDPPESCGAAETQRR